MMQPRPEDLHDIIWILRTAQHVDAVRLFADAIERRLTDPDAPTLDAILGLTAPGKASPATRLAITRRDDALRRFRREHHPDLSDRAAAALMASAMLRYETTRWIRDRDAGHAPPDGLAAIAHSALSAGVALPSERTLPRILSP